MASSPNRESPGMHPRSLLVLVVLTVATLAAADYVPTSQYTPVWGTDPRDPGFPVAANFPVLQPNNPPAGVNVPARVTNGLFSYSYDGVTYEKIPFVSGVNFGATKPGFQPGDLALSKQDYLRHFQHCATLQIQYMRTYTTLTSDFYEALYEFNLSQRIAGRNPILLLHGIWTPEPQMNGEDTGSDAFDPYIMSIMEQNIQQAVDAVHGRSTMDYASTFSTEFEIDVSQYILGWVLGTEWSPNTVNVTNIAHIGMQPYQGTYVEAAPSASPFETWCAMMLDKLAIAEMGYNSQHPIGLTNWVTTDPIRNILEPSAPVSYDDWQSVDATHIRTKQNWNAGYFVSFHAYPYYPAFLDLPYAPFPRIVNASVFPDVTTPGDPYASYIERLRTYFTGYCLIIAEVGIPTSIGSSQFGFDDRDHGFMEESLGAQKLIDCMNIIYNSGMQGVVVFELFDEWFKVNWNTENVDYQRQQWHNQMSSEQFFGMVASEAQSPVVLDGDDSDWNDIPNFIEQDSSSSQSAPLKRLAVTTDLAFLYVLMERPAGSWTSEDTFILSFDTIPNQGSNVAKLFPSLNLDQDADALLVVANGTMSLFVHTATDQYYNEFASLYDGVTNPESYAKDLPEFNLFRLLTKYPTYVGDWPARYFLNRQLLYVGNFIHGNTNINSNNFNNLATWNVAGDLIEVRIPWMMLGFANPSNQTVFVFNGYGTAMTIDFEQVPSISIQGQWISSPPAANVASKSDLFEQTMDVVDEYCYCERYKSGITYVAATLASMATGSQTTPSDFYLPRGYIFCECSNGIVEAPFEMKGYLVLAAFSIFVVGTAYVAFVHPFVTLYLDFHYQRDKDEFRGRPRVLMQVISGLIFVAIIVGFGLFLYYNGGGSDQVLALVAERTFDQSYGMLLLFVFLLSWDSMELMFGILFIPWKNLPLRRSQDEPKQPGNTSVEASTSLGRSIGGLSSQQPLFSDVETLSRDRFYVVVACHNSSKKLETTLSKLLRHIHPYQIVIADNGSTRQEEHDTDKVCARMSEMYMEQNPEYNGPGIKVGHISEGSKSSAQLSACFNLQGIADLVTLMDDDTFVADNFDVDEVISHFQKDNSVQCVGYCLRAAQRRRWLEVLEDFEYMIASFMKTIQASMGTALFASGAINTWRTSTIVDVLIRHDTMHHGDDLQQGLIMHSLAGKEYFLDPEKTHIGHYKVKISSNFVFTDVPLHWMHWSDFFNKHVQPCPCGEPSLLLQRGKGWDVSRHRFVFKYLKMIFSCGGISWTMFFARVVAVHDLIMVLNDWVSIFYFVVLLIILQDRLLLLYSYIVAWAIQIFVYFTFSISVLLPKGLWVPPEVFVIYPLLYKLPSMFFLRLYAMFYNVLYYVPFVRNKATIKQRLREGDMKPINNVLIMSRTWNGSTPAAQSTILRSNSRMTMDEGRNSVSGTIRRWTGRSSSGSSLDAMRVSIEGMRNSGPRPLPPIPTTQSEADLATTDESISSTFDTTNAVVASSVSEGANMATSLPSNGAPIARPPPYHRRRQAASPRPAVPPPYSRSHRNVPHPNLPDVPAEDN